MNFIVLSLTCMSLLLMSLESMGQQVVDIRCPSPQSIQTKKQTSDPNQGWRAYDAKAYSMVSTHNYPSQMMEGESPVMTPETFSHASLIRETDDLLCEYYGKTEDGRQDVLFLDLHGMSRTLHDCKFKYGDHFECFAENTTCVLECTK